MADQVTLFWTPSDHDAERYGLDGEQVMDADRLNDMPASELQRLEAVLLREVGLPLEHVWPPMVSSVAASRAALWLSLRLAGRELEWDEFDPQVRRTVFAWRPTEGGDVDPPDGSPAPTSSPDEP